jgi:hypothetical protein
MNTAVATAPAARAPKASAPPVQLGFLDPPAEPPHLRVAITGMLVRHAELRISADGRPHLVIVVVQPKGGLPFVAMYHDSEAERTALEHLAAHLIPGAVVLLRGAGLALTRNHGADAIELRHCDSVSLVSFTAPPEEVHAP